jgi:FHA domain/Bacterial regulatory protein, Fis family
MEEGPMAQSSQSYQTRGLNSQEGRTTVNQPKTSGFYQRGTAIDGGWGFVIPRVDGTIEVVPARNGAVIGSGDEADVRIVGPEVAPLHARIEVRADGAYLEDLDSPGGTFVGGVRAQRIGMAHGDVVRFGKQLAIFAERGLSNYEGRIDADGPIVVGPRDRVAFVEPACAYARAGQSFTIEGGPGLGKRTLAALAASEREGAGPSALIDGSAAEPEAIAQARSQRTVTWIVVHAERLPRALQTEISQAAARDNGVVIATLETPLDRALGDGLVGPGFAGLFNGRRLLLPPLSARREDIPGIVYALSRRLGIEAERISVDWIEQIARAGWPEGITEIEEVMREAAEGTEGSLDLKSVRRQLSRPPSSSPSPPAADDPALARERLVDALARASGSIASAARTLGMSRQAVYREAQRLGLEVGKRRARG